MVRSARWFALVAGAMLVLGGCSKGENGGAMSGSPPASRAASPSAEPSEATTPLSSGELANLHGVKDVSGVPSVELELDDYYFGPTILTGRAGQSIKLELFNEGDNQHNFTLTAQGINQTIDPGKRGEVTVKFPQTGSASFFCAFHGASHNMRGDLRTKS